jgi:hypothetical protein
VHIKQWSAAALVAAAALTTAACGGSTAAAASPEANAKKVVELLTQNKTDDAKKLMTDAEQKRVAGRSGIDVLGNKRMNADCKTSDGTKSEENGVTVVQVPYECGADKFTIKVQFKDNLVDRINYT